MDKELQAEFDYVILGTNFENSVLAGALSRVGKRVLLIDNNSYYGSNNATLCFSELHNLASEKKGKDLPYDVTPLSSEERLRLLNQPITRRKIDWEKESFTVDEEEPITPDPYSESDISYRPVIEEWNTLPIAHWQERIGTITSPEGESVSAESLLQQQNRRYNLDLNSAMLLSQGEVVSVLAESGLGQYAQFYPMNSISAFLMDQPTPSLVKLPCSRQEVFMSKAISLKDKRLLAKFIQFIGDSVASSEQDAKAVNDVELKQGRSLSRPQNKSVLKIDLHAYDTIPFVDFLEKEFQITGVLKDMIIYSICLSGSDRTFLSDSHQFAPLLTPDGIQRVQEFITSLNVYGATPFLYPIYGGGDVLQSFCRINNVYAGITMLQTQVVGVIVRKKDRSVVAVEVANESIHTVIRCRNVIASDDYPLTETDAAEVVTGRLAHGIYVFRGNNKKLEVGGDQTVDSIDGNKKVDSIDGSQTVDSIDGNQTVDSIYGNQKKAEKDLREIVVVPANATHRAIYLLVVGVSCESHSSMNEEFKMSGKGESVIYAFMELQETTEVEAMYAVMDDSVHAYLKQLHSTVPVEVLLESHFVEVSRDCPEYANNYHYVPTRREGCYLYMDHRMQRVRSLFEKICPDLPFLPKTHSSQEAEKEDEVIQELSLIDQLEAGASQS